MLRNFLYAFNLFPHYLFLPGAGAVALITIAAYEWWRLAAMRLNLRYYVPVLFGVAYFLWGYLKW